MDLSTALAQVPAVRATIPDDVIKTGCDLVGKLLGRPCQVVGDLLADEVYFFQWNNRLRILAKAAQQLKGRKVDPRTMPPGFLIPLLEACGNTADENLQELWSKLLSNAAQSESAQHPLFVDVLRRMSSKDAGLFSAICRGDHLGGDLAQAMAEGISMVEGQDARWSARPQWQVPRGRRDLLPLVSHLVALNLVSIAGVFRVGNDEVGYPLLNITPFGAEFFDAVSVPGESEHSGSAN